MGAQQVLHGDLQWKQRVLELVRQAAGEFAPSRHPLCLHQALLLIEQLPRHLVERVG